MEKRTWTQTLRKLYEKANTRYAAGDHELGGYFDSDEIGFLNSVGLKPIHLYDYAEDFQKHGEPDWETALLIMAARRDYFLYEMHGQLANSERTSESLPPKTEEMEGIVWLPRLIAKARSFLEGALAQEVMYGCGGDRRFFKEHDVHPADFLRAVWGARGDDAKVLAFVRSCEP